MLRRLNRYISVFHGVSLTEPSFVPDGSVLLRCEGVRCARAAGPEPGVLGGQARGLRGSLPADHSGPGAEVSTHFVKLSWKTTAQNSCLTTTGSLTFKSTHAVIYNLFINDNQLIGKLEAWKYSNKTSCNLFAGKVIINELFLCTLYP